MRKSDFTKFINSLEEEELRAELSLLFDKVKAVKDHYGMELGSTKDRSRIFANAKKSVTRYYATKSYRKPKAPRIRYIQSLLKEMNHLSIFKHEMADLYLFDVETALDFMKKYYFTSTSVNNNLEKSFISACEIIQDGNYQSMFADRVETIMAHASRNRDIYWTFNKIFLNTFRKQ